MNTFWGDLTDTTAEKASLTSMLVDMAQLKRIVVYDVTIMGGYSLAWTLCRVV